MARTDTPGSMNFFGLRGAFGRGGVKPSGSSSSYPRSNVRITTAPPTRPAVKASVPKAAPVKPKTSVRVAERAKPVKPAKPAKAMKKKPIMVTTSTAKFDHRTGEVVWTKQKPVPLKVSKAPKPAKPMPKTSPKKKKK